MSKKFGAIALVALLALGFIASGGFAESDDGSTTRAMAGPGSHGFDRGYGSDIQNIIEEGTYQDLVDLREETGLDLMPHIDSEDDFEAIQDEAQERVTLRERLQAFYESGTYADLEALRDEFGRNFMPWVDSDEELDQAQELNMEKNGLMGDGIGKMHGPRGGMRNQFDGDCPNADDTTE